MLLKYVPNILTIIRFLLIPPIIIAIAIENFIWALILLILSAVTDVLDGAIARKFNLVSDFGKLVDPLADKTTQTAKLVTLAVKGIIPFWILAVVIIKEFAMISGASFLYGKELVVSSKWYGKLATVLFYVAIACSLIIRYLNKNVLDTTIYDFSIYIYCLAVASTLLALVLYFRAFNMQKYIKEEVKKQNSDE